MSHSTPDDATFLSTRDETQLSADHATVLSAGADPAAPARRPALDPGAIFGSYRIERLLGRGGMGEVYQAEHLEHGRHVALKVLNQRLSGAGDRARFLVEGRLAASISHTNCVYVFGSEEIDGTPAITMELLPGGTLKDLVERDGPMDPGKAVDAVLQLVAGLEAAHAAGILHRDIKPSNCFVDADGAVKVGDFGLSISTERRGPDPTARVFQGTPQYAAPEQIAGEALDVRADLYAVGATLYYLLTGAPPFDDRDLPTLIQKVRTEPPRSPRDLQPAVPPGLARIVLQLLAKRPDDRVPSYAALARQLHPYESAAPAAAGLGLRFSAGLIDHVLLTLATMPLAAGDVDDVARQRHGDGHCRVLAARSVRHAGAGVCRLHRVARLLRRDGRLGRRVDGQARVRPPRG
jgi:serine/threonine protein kinase